MLGICEARSSNINKIMIRCIMFELLNILSIISLNCIYLAVADYLLIVYYIAPYVFSEPKIYQAQNILLFKTKNSSIFYLVLN